MASWSSHAEEMHSANDLYTDVYKELFKKVGFLGNARVAVYKGKEYVILSGKGRERARSRF